ncbi:MAG: IucA/IucC family C-terminal-domain containing protein [Pseudomonadota bacterium]|nr:IucA/IucC family C-terminal-domain containing protein [Pseudomonadota bacterium]
MSAKAIERHVIEQLPPALGAWMTLERFHLHKPGLFQNTARDPAFDGRYFPQHCRPFLLPCYWVPRRCLYVRGGQAPGVAQLNFFAGGSTDERVLFPIHPSAIDSYKTFLRDADARDAIAAGARIWAVPTSSTRTLLAWPDGEARRAVFIKTSLHSRIFGDRHVSRLKVARSTGLYRVVRDSPVALPGALHFLPEVAGFSPRGVPDSGALIRLVPQQIVEGQVWVAPLFSLLGASEARQPLLLTLLERSDMEPVRWVDQVLCASFAPLWLEMTLRHGLILEAHAQDLLLGLHADGVPSGHFYYRDFEGLQVDWELRRARGWPAPHDLPNAWAWRETYATWGYRYSDLLWYKWRVSLFDYLHFVLNEVEASLREWHERGLLPGPRCEPDEITMLFSRHMFAAVEKMFGVRGAKPYNIYRSLNRFVASLLKLRKAAMRSLGRCWR